MSNIGARDRKNRLASLAAFMATKADFDILLAELREASDDHFSIDPANVLWQDAAWLQDAATKLREIADSYFKRGDFAEPTTQVAVAQG